MKNIFMLMVISPLFLDAQWLHLDRKVYMPGDLIQGTAYFTNENLLNQTFYITLFSELGINEAREMYFFTKENNSFSLDIPLGLQSGYYSIQFNNYQNKVVSHVKKILIINEENFENISITDTYDKPLNNESANPFFFYVNGDNGTLKYKPKNHLISDLASMSVSITDLSQNILTHDQAYNCDLANQHSIAHKGLNNFLNGYHLRGKVVDDNNNPVPNHSIIFTYHLDKLYLKSLKSNEKGEFVIYNIMHEGVYDIFLRAIEPEDESKLKIIVEENMNNAIRYHEGCEEEFIITKPQLTELIRKRILDKKVKANYLELTKKPIWEPNGSEPILSNRDNIVDLDDYFPMGSIKELIKETVPHVFFNKDKIRVFSPELRRSLPKHPVLLINGVSVSNDDVMNLSPDNVKYVELINKTPKLARYGAFAKGGIISFITRNGVEFGSEITKHQLKGFKKYSLDKKERKTDQPYFPSMLYWNPSLKPTDKKLDIDFELPDYPATLLLEATIRLNDGSLFSIQQKLNIINE